MLLILQTWISSVGRPSELIPRTLADRPSGRVPVRPPGRGRTSFGCNLSKSLSASAWPPDFSHCSVLPFVSRPGVAPGTGGSPLALELTWLLPLHEGLSGLSPQPNATNSARVVTADPGSALIQGGRNGLLAGTAIGMVEADGGGWTTTVSHGPVLGSMQSSPVGSVPLSGSLPPKAKRLRS